MKNCSLWHPQILLLKSFSLRSSIKHETQCFITRWNTLKFLKNTLLRVVFATLFSVFWWWNTACHAWYITSQRDFRKKSTLRIRLVVPREFWTLVEAIAKLSSICQISLVNEQFVNNSCGYKPRSNFSWSFSWEELSVTPFLPTTLTTRDLWRRSERSSHTPSFIFPAIKRILYLYRGKRAQFNRNE